MKHRTQILTLTIFTAIILAACSAQPTLTEAMSEKEMAAENTDDKTDEMMTEESSEKADKTSDSMDSDTMDEGAMGEETMTGDDDEMKSDEDGVEEDMIESSDKETLAESDGDMMSPDWFSEPLTNARNGETFTIADFKGKVILVETMAIWCSNCLKQQQQVYDLHQMFDADNFVSVGIDIDSRENIEALNAYIIDNEFNWYYAVAPEHVAREIGNLYGSQFLNPPSTPMLIIDSHGEVHTLPFGIKDAEVLFETLQPFLNEGM